MWSTRHGFRSESVIVRAYALPLNETEPQGDDAEIVRRLIARIHSEGFTSVTVGALVKPDEDGHWGGYGWRVAVSW